MCTPSDDVDRTSLFSVHGLIAVVTGGGTGIGRMIATALENNGATVYIVGRRLDVLEAAARESSRHGKMHALLCDVTSKELLLELVAKLKAKHGHINLLVNNAGVSYHDLRPPIIRLGETKENIKDLQKRLWEGGAPEKWARTFEVNCTAVYFCTVAFLELLDAGNRAVGEGGVTSQVITVSSVAGFRRDARNFSVSYSMSKAAATHLGKTLATALGTYKIRSNVIAPGYYPSEMSAGIVSDDLIQNGIPLQRAGTVEDMGGLALFLASRAGAYVDGTVHLTDGGRLGLFSSTY